MNGTVTDEQLEALEVARALVDAGVPLFVAPADASHAVGFRLPGGWQHSAPDPAVLER